ncbi:MAG: alpha/beta hydrolase [Actinomycetota bacterium]
MSAVFFVWCLVALVVTVNALRPPVPPHRRFPPLWLPGMLVSELAPALFLIRALVAAGFVALGAHQGGLGRLALLLFVVSEAGLVVLMGRTIRSARDTGRAPSLLTLGKVWESLPPEVELTAGVHYRDSLTLDVYSRAGEGDAPALIYLHPGSWMRGRPGRQARPLLYGLAREGWVVLDIRYPLSPHATFPEHLIGVKRAIAWARTEGSGKGIDPDRIAIAGASSGAHLAALAALTAHRTDLQPGFEDVDVSVVACAVFYGIYDLLVRNPTRYDWPFVSRHVMKASPDDAPDLYRLGSPIDQVRAEAPPFLVVHGGFDSAVLADESRHFVAALRAAGAYVEHHEVEAAQHGFDAVASHRTRAVGAMTRAWLHRVVVESSEPTRG